MNYFLKVKDDRLFSDLLGEQLEQNPDLWGQFGFRKAQQAHSEMTDIWVRYNEPRLIGTPDFNEEHDSVWYPAYDRLPALKPIIYRLMRDVEGERIGGVLITKIPPGCGIAPHVDKSWHVDYYDKFYLSVNNSPGSIFCAEGDAGFTQVLEPKPGEIWRFDNRNLHWVQNMSTEDRITLIICIRTEKYRNALGADRPVTTGGDALASVA